MAKNIGRIPVAEPALVGREREYVLDCLESSWISSTGRYIDLFEQAFARYVGVRHALTCTNGTAALHLALLALGVSPGDEVIVPTLTYVACANAIAYCGARPVFIDSEPDSWNLDPEQLAQHIGPRTKGVMVVHLYGHPVDVDPVLELCRARGLFVLEDAAEAHGAQYKGRNVGGLGTVATFSFYGNKVITTGEGGMITTDDDGLAARMRILKGQGMDPQRRYWFPVLGYNYRMTNLAAAIGLAQLEKVDWHLARRRANADRYAYHLSGVTSLTLQAQRPWAACSHWLTSVLLAEEDAPRRDAIMRALDADGIETRPLFYPMHQLPMYTSACEGRSYPVAEQLSRRGINLPSSSLLADEQIDFVCSRLRHHLATA